MFFDILAGISSGLDPFKRMRDVRTIIFAAVSRSELCYVSENEGLRFWKW